VALATRRQNRGAATASTHGGQAAAALQPSPAQWAAVWKLFDALSGVPAPQRAQRLRAAGGDPLVISEVESLLRSSEGNGFLDQSIAGPDAGPMSGYASLASGTMIGQFRILHLIGRGGMGEVYLAQRVQGGFDQRVALKMLRPEAVTRAELFGSERGILANLEHPGIARLIDGGTADDGRPFMALEYVEGEAIHDWCDSRRASLSVRLKLFLEICDAVSYAHGRLVVHLDLKPNNVLVDRDGRVRLLDFGIARIVDDGHDTSLTKTLLTPDYAAPEQLENKPVTVATDVYSLGAVLFKLLAGSGPWQSENAAVSSTVLRILRGDPPSPSSVVAPDQRMLVPARAIAGDLDAIVLKAMRRTPQDRYPSVGDLAADVRRHLANLPVQARASTTSYRIRRFVRRNRWGVLATLLILAVIIAGTGAVVIKETETAKERDVARAQTVRLRAANQTMLTMFRDADDNANLHSTSIHTMMERTTRNLVQSLPAQSPAVSEKIRTLADLYLNAGDWRAAKPLLEGALSRGIGKSDPVGAARLKVKLAMVYLQEKKFSAVKGLLNEANAVWRSDHDRFLRDRAETIDVESLLLRAHGKYPESVELLASNLDDAEKAMKYYDYDLGLRYKLLSLYFTGLGRLGSAASLLQRGEKLFEHSDIDRTDDLTTLYIVHAGIEVMRGDLNQAKALTLHAINTRIRIEGYTIKLAGCLRFYAHLLIMTGQPREALAVLGRAAIFASTFDRSNGRFVLAIDGTKLEALAALGRTEEAEHILTTLTPDFTRLEGNAQIKGIILRGRAALRISEGKTDEAVRDLDAAAAQFKTADAPGELPDIARLRAAVNRPKARDGSTLSPVTSVDAPSVR
jgi:serine/threonine protein kinase/tetratricopeptide (TPR) repeat protein